MFCKFCGNQIDDDSVFCSKCGKTLQAGDSAEQGDISAQTPIVPQQTPAAPPQVPAAPSSKNNTLKIVLIIVFAVLFWGLTAIGGCIFVMYKAVSEGIAAVKGENDLTDATFTAKLPDGETLEMVRIPNCARDGFMMGSPSYEDKRESCETQHRVYLTKDFYLGKYEVTQAQWQALMGNNPSYFKGANRPVEQVSYNDAIEFCKKLTARGHDEGWLPNNWKFTLPTEAQWEYACRAGTTTPFSYGSSSDVYKMNSGGNSPYGGAEKGVSRKSTVEVGSLGYKNAFGLYDMHGNVFEWCLDSCNYNNNGMVTDTYRDGIRNPLCTTGSKRVKRGGSWNFIARCCRSASRYSIKPTVRYCHIGFRLALVPDQWFNDWITHSLR